MTQEDKELLLKDFCARLPYGVLFMVHDDEINEPVELLSINPKRVKPLEIDDGPDENSSTYWNLEDAKPYLRPMSSMTMEEIRYKLSKFFKIINTNIEGIGYVPTLKSSSAIAYINWLNENHFDYNGLIEKGLALEAPEGMYTTE